MVMNSRQNLKKDHVCYQTIDYRTPDSDLRVQQNEILYP
ncbi:hypothetical protein GCHA_1242 [Paraglaciecola chathamensis S18K6]|uniref:Uncharacterized protein n=2 Tax=Paraglaciecola chathamensis TaxID=368405 RepID=A0ABQ0IED0_9ALTE|nr:hypothetical protein GAGA_4814 [Paraglaciecola agarilytica NO2]GAC09203.1 hypothetical protein GCHA_1242 [Paraglaciecola chathamensis S18K6]